jgi:hypothetical protein
MRPPGSAPLATGKGTAPAVSKSPKIRLERPSGLATYDRAVSIPDPSRDPGIDPGSPGAPEALSAPDVRTFALISGLGRIAIGAGLALAPQRALGALGFADASPATVAVARIAGSRDIVLGVATLAAIGDAGDLRRASLACAAVDGGDAASFAALLGQGEDVREAAIRGLAAAVPATLAGLWVAHRLAGR